MTSKAAILAMPALAIAISLACFGLVACGVSTVAANSQDIRPPIAITRYDYDSDRLVAERTYGPGEVLEDVVLYEYDGRDSLFGKVHIDVYEGVPSEGGKAALEDAVLAEGFPLSRLGSLDGAPGDAAVAKSLVMSEVGGKLAAAGVDIDPGACEFEAVAEGVSGSVVEEALPAQGGEAAETRSHDLAADGTLPADRTESAQGGQRETAHSHDASGNLEAAVVAGDGGAVAESTERVRDELGREVERVEVHGQSTWRILTEYAGDGLAKTETVVDAASGERVAFNEYDGDGNLVRESGWHSELGDWETRRVYDEQGRLTWESYTMFGVTDREFSTYRYDEQGRLVEKGLNIDVRG